MARWLAQVVSLIQQCAEGGRVRLTRKAEREMFALGCDAGDVLEVLAGLTEEEFDDRLRSELTGEWMYVFKPWLERTVVYLKVILRDGCLVVSFHEDENDEEEFE